MTKTTKLTVAQFLAEWATLHPRGTLAEQVKTGAKIAGIMNGAEGRKPKVPHELFFCTVEKHQQSGCNLEQALFNAGRELDCLPNSTDPNDNYRLLWQRYDRAKKALNKSA